MFKSKHVILQGAPERIFARCNRMLINGREEHLNEDWKARFNSAYEQLVKLNLHSYFYIKNNTIISVINSY